MGMKHAAMMAIAALALTAVPAWATCVKITIGDTRHLEFGISPEELKAVRRAYEGIANAAGISPAFWLCDATQPDAQVRQGPKHTAILMTTGMVKLFGADADAIAAILGHEFGHVIHNHIRRSAAFQRETFNQAVADVERRIATGEEDDSAISTAAWLGRKRNAAFSRNNEREADDEGFALTQLAGFDSDASRRAHEKLKHATGSGRSGWLATHPTQEERIGTSGRLKLNEEFRMLAQEHLRERRYLELRAVLDTWVRAVPQSGAAAYYRGVLLLRSESPAADAAEAFEDAITYYSGGALSRASQSYQTEGAVSSVALCIALHREGKEVATLHCLKRLETDEEVELFRVFTGWRDFLLVGRKPHVPQGPLFTAKVENGAIMISNCGHVAANHGLKELKMWQGTRAARKVEASDQPTICAPNGCCEPVDLDKLLPDGVRPMKHLRPAATPR